MRRLVKDTSRKVFLILDNLRAYHSKKIAAWPKKHKDEIEIFFLPPYAPEYNPDELLNSDLKRGLSKKSMPRSEKELESNPFWTKTRQRKTDTNVKHSTVNAAILLKILFLIS